MYGLRLLGIGMMAVSAALIAASVVTFGWIGGDHMVRLADCVQGACTVGAPETIGRSLFLLLGKLMFVAAWLTVAVLFSGVIVAVQRRDESLRAVMGAAAVMPSVVLLLTIGFVVAVPQSDGAGAFGLPVLIIGCVGGISGSMFVLKGRDAAVDNQRAQTASPVAPMPYDSTYLNHRDSWEQDFQVPTDRYVA